ncbi:MurR/RpiR family transcriptional regulator [Evansella clarkii]|uniref:MurR/RpiR family transcriptional regulator n=1 Tax=Evansella clarkii TaxID=79879 RepID=UPI001ADD37A3|nr:MurR/RpiR family transcriptional regulator [Evansella clarkii]
MYSFFNGLVKIKESASHLKPSEQKVANYIINHPQEILDLSISKLAKVCKVSEATIIRMCRSLGFKGFKELKLNISASLSMNETLNTKYEDISELKYFTEVKHIVDFVTINNLKSIENTLSIIDYGAVEQAINILDSARKIDVYGVGASGVIAIDVEQKFARINRWCQAYPDNHGQLTSAAHLTDKDTVLAISYSGETQEIIDSIKIAKQNGAKIISLTKYGKSRITQMADVCLFASSLEKSIRSGAMASRIAQLNIIDIIYTGVASKNYEEAVKYLESTRKSIKNRK